MKRFDLINYELVCNYLYFETENLKFGESIVIKTFKALVKTLFGIDHELQ